MDKKFRLPKDQFIDGQDVEGHRTPPADDEAPKGEGLYRYEPVVGEGLQDEDVEGHLVTRTDGEGDDFTILPAPPSIGLRRTPGHGGE